MAKFKWFHAKKQEHHEHAYHSPLEHKVDEILSPFHEYIKSQVTASAFLLVCTVLAIVLASWSLVSSWYDTLVNTPVGFRVAHFAIEEPLQFWTNDVLLTLFFFFVGLEIKREFLAGELTDRKRSIFVIFSAVGGMVVPITIYLLFNGGTQHHMGWGIPMATDTAFALGILSCFRQRLPKGIFTFLAALAIIDDIGAIIVIAIFYTPSLNTTMLLFTLLFSGVLILFNYAGIRKPFPYLLIGLVIWWCVENAGIHGTVAGILVAFLIPARPQKGPEEFLDDTKKLLADFEEKKKSQKKVLEDSDQHEMIDEVRIIAEQATTPLQRWESQLELPIALIILPLFALVNAGVPINWHLIGDVFSQKLGLGVFIGLLIGKPLGIVLFGKLSLWLNAGKLPDQTPFSTVAAAAVIAGVGFTMSLFIADLSFQTEHQLVLAKAAILFASLLAGILGAIGALLIKPSNR